MIIKYYQLLMIKYIVNVISYELFHKMFLDLDQGPKSFVFRLRSMILITFNKNESLIFIYKTLLIKVDQVINSSSELNRRMIID